MSRQVESNSNILKHARAHLMSVRSDSPDLQRQRRSKPGLKIRWQRQRQKKKKKKSQQTLGGWERLPNKHSCPCLRFSPTYNWLCASRSSQHSDLFIKDLQGLSTLTTHREGGERAQRGFLELCGTKIPFFPAS